MNVSTWIYAQVLVISIIVGTAGLTFAEEVDLSKIDRSIRREPVWKSSEPRYCLFVVLKGDAWDNSRPGKPATRMIVAREDRRVWFVQDGEDLYMDINENGDLSDPGEKLPRLELSDEERRKVKNESDWKIPAIEGTNGEPLITNIQIKAKASKGIASADHVVVFSAPGRRDVCVSPTFSDKPADAPIVHVTGPKRLSVSVRRSYLPPHRNVSNDFHVDGHMYLEPLGPGSPFLLEAAGFHCRIEFPMSDGSIKVSEMHLRNYITGPYQTANARLPEGVDNEGKVRITLSTRTVNIPAVIERLPTELRAVRREK